MLSGEEILLYCKSRGVTESGLAMVELILSSDPARIVKSNAYTTSGRFVSRKNGMIIQFESLHVELSYLILAEN